MRTLRELWKDESGVSATEYGIIAAIIAVGLIAVLINFRQSLRDMFGRASEAVNSQ